MPAPMLHLGATVLCSHAGQATPVAPFPRVTVSGQPVVTVFGSGETLERVEAELRQRVATVKQMLGC